MDKSELETLLVKLKLGTITVDDAIEELHLSCFNDNELKPRSFLPTAFRNIIYAHKLSAEVIKEQIDKFINLKTDFICVGLDTDKMTYLESNCKTITIKRESNMAFKIKKISNKSTKKVVVISSAYANIILAKECMQLLSFLGYDYECLTDIRLDDIKKVINYLTDVDLIILISGSDYSLVSNICEYTSQPIIVIDDECADNINHLTALASTGVIYVDSTSSFSAVVATYRILGHK